MSLDESHLEGRGAPFLAFREDGSILIANDAVRRALGCTTAVLKQLGLRDLVDGGTAATLEHFMSDRTERRGPMRFAPIPVRKAKRLKSCTMVPELFELHPTGRILILEGMSKHGECGLVGDLESELALLRRFVRDSAQAMWCMVFDEPVDLTVNDAEVVRQVFENPCHWGICNQAMARMYNLPPGLDMTQMPVSAFFRRSTANEAFVSILIEANFNIDAVPTVELRHDGSVMYAETSVRADVIEGRLHRMWGIQRDVTDERVSKSHLESQERKVSKVLAALPDGVLVIDNNRTVLAVNPALEALLDWPADMILGRNAGEMIDLDQPLPNGRHWYGRDVQRWCAKVKRRNGDSVDCDIHLAPIAADESQYFVLSFRQALVGAPTQGSTGAQKRPRKRPPKVDG